MKELGLILLTMFLTSLWSKYFEPMLPDKKKIISGTKKVLRFTIKYALLILLLIYVFWKMELNKFFIFNVVVIVFIITYRIFNDIIYNFKVDFIKKQTRGLKKENKNLEKLNKKINN